MTADPADPGGFIPQPRQHVTFRLSTLLLTITLIAVCLGVGRLAPGVGIGLAMLVTPAWIRTLLAGRRARGEGKPLTIEEKIFVFFASLVEWVAGGLRT